MLTRRQFNSTASAVALAATATATFAAEQCDMPLEGTWLLEAGETMTIAGPGGGTDRALFEMEVEGCGETLILTNFGPAETGVVKTFHQEDGVYQWGTSYRGVPISITVQSIDAETMSAEWRFAGTLAGAPGAMTFQSDAAVGNIDPRCDCPVFVNTLKSAIESNDYFIALYSALSLRPEGLDEDLPWQSDVSEALIDLQNELGVSLKEAVDIANSMPGGRTRLTDDNLEAEIWRRLAVEESSGDGASEGDVSLSDTPNTDAKSCDIDEEFTRATGCAADILNASTDVHEQVHRRACLAQTELENSWNFLDGGEKPPSYLLLTDDPANLAAEEIQAYRASNKFIRSTYEQICGKQLD